jgi:hypothetical protein
MALKESTARKGIMALSQQSTARKKTRKPLATPPPSVTVAEPTPSVPELAATQPPLSTVEWMTVAQIRTLLTEVRQLLSENRLELNTVLSNQMTVEQFCTFFALGQHKKRFRKN